MSLPYVLTLLAYRGHTKPGLTYGQRGVDQVDGIEPRLRTPPVSAVMSERPQRSRRRGGALYQR